MRNLMILILLSITFQLNAQVDTKAKAILDKLSAKTKSYSSIKADFELKMENSIEGLNEINAGNIIIQGNKYKLSLSGMGAEIFSNGKTQWTYMHEAKEVNISEPDPDSDDALNPTTLFTIYEKGYSYKLKGEIVKNGKSIYSIELMPTTEKDFKSVVLLIDKASMQITSATMQNKDGNQYTINVKKMETDAQYPASTFEFDTTKYPGVEINDMR